MPSLEQSLRASTRWVLVLMLWLLPWLQMVKSEFSMQKFKTDRTWDSPVVIPKDGVYLVSVMADPCERCVSILHVHCQCQGTETILFTAYGSGICGHGEMATGLKRNDKLFIEKVGKLEAWSSLTVVYVADLNSFYISVLNALRTNNSPVTYTYRFTPNGWSTLNNTNKITTFNIPTTGMYWVTARPNPMSKRVYMTVKIGSKDLFTVYAEKTKAVSTSGAFHLTAGSNISAVTRGGTYGPQTLLSAVYLAGNKKPNTYPFEHIAFTAKFPIRRNVAAKEVLLFQRVLTNYGYIHVGGYTEIRRTGSYMVSIRPDPESASTVIVNLYVNGRLYWAIYAEEGVPVGATISLSLQVGSYLEVRNVKATTLGSGTMFSIAFIQP